MSSAEAQLSLVLCAEQQKAQVSYCQSHRHPAFGDPTCGAFIRMALILADVSEDAN